jgi:WD domain, G-beta repeat/Pentapeptide repeats (8 copies)
VTAQLITETSSEIEQGTLSRLVEQGLALATAREDVRQTQQRLLLAPLLSRLHNVYRGRNEMEERLLALLAQLREQRGHLRGLDLSQLAIRGASLQGVEMQDANLSEATLQDTVFTETFDAIITVATSPNGTFWAAGSRRGEVRVRKAHQGTIQSLKRSPDGRLLASCGDDGAIMIWDLVSGEHLRTLRRRRHRCARWERLRRASLLPDREVCLAHACRGNLSEQ